MTLIDMNKDELLIVYRALQFYRTDQTEIDPCYSDGLTEEQKANYIAISNVMDKVSQIRKVCDCGGKSN